MGTLWGLHNLQTYLQSGFTTLRDAGEQDLAYGQLALRDAINSGLITGPRLFSAGNFVSITGGHGDADALSPDQALPRRPNIADTVDEVSDAVRHEAIIDAISVTDNDRNRIVSELGIANGSGSD